METLWNGQAPPGEELSPLTLAFVGDGVYELFVREYLADQGNCPVRKLHDRAVAWVRCETQARLLRETLEPLLSSEEKEVVRRGRNAHVGHVPKNAAVGDYHAATALEALFGWLYLRGELGRLRQLFAAVVESASEE